MARRYKHLVLLRGINVGGKNLIPMAELRRCFEGMGFEEVSTYIQSGNVLFRGSNVDEGSIESQLNKAFGYPGRVVAISGRRFNAMVTKAPDWWGRTDTEKHNALFTLPGTTPGRVLAALPSPSDHEQIATAPGVIFWSGDKNRLTRTMFVSKLAGHPMYQELTVRNSNTFFKLADLMAEM